MVRGFQRKASNAEVRTVFVMEDAREYSFEERMAMSQGVVATADVRSILLENIPGAANVHTAAKPNDQKGVDWWVEHISAKHLSVDTKVREKDWWKTHPKEDDLALETWSVINKKPGWTRDPTKRTDYVLWLWEDTKRFCLLPFPMLCAVFQDHWQEWRQKYKTRPQKTPEFGGYWSECTFVPRRLVWSEIYLRYSGSVIVSEPGQLDLFSK